MLGSASVQVPIEEKLVGLDILVDRVEKRYGTREALRGFSLAVEGDWNVLGLLGRNGAGKTTFLKMLVGFLPFNSGTIRIRIDGRDYAYLDPRCAVFVPEDQNLLTYVTGRQYLGIFESLNRLAGVRVDHALRDQLCREFDLADALNISISKMSKGMRRKLELAAALSSDVPLIVADEMPEGLDVPSMKVLSDCIRRLARSGRRFLVSTHDLAFIQGVSDNVVVIDNGVCRAVISAREHPNDFVSKVYAAFESPSDS